MKAYLGLSDPARVPGEPTDTVFGIPRDERNFVRLRIA